MSGGGRGGRRGAAVAAAVALAVTGVTVAVAAVTRSADRGYPAALEAARPALDRAGCRGLETFDSEGRRHLQRTDRYDGYGTVPPTSGMHAFQPFVPEDPVVDRQPPVEELVHNLEHGYVVIWHDGVDAGEVSRLGRVAEGRDKVIVTPLEYRDSLPDGARLAITGWQTRVLCDRVDEAALRELIGYLHGPGQRAPEPSAA